MRKLLWVDGKKRNTGSIEAKYKTRFTDLELHRVTSNETAFEFCRSGNYDFIFYDLDMDQGEYGFAKFLKQIQGGKLIGAGYLARLPDFFDETIEPETIALQTGSLEDFLDKYGEKSQC